METDLWEMTEAMRKKNLKKISAKAKKRDFPTNLLNMHKKYSIASIVSLDQPFNLMLSYILNQAVKELIDPYRAFWIEHGLTNNRSAQLSDSKSWIGSIRISVVSSLISKLILPQLQ